VDPIYLDHNATTPVNPEVVESMLPYLGEQFGNASSAHNFGREAKVALEIAREQIAAFINCRPSELYFTSGGTESDNIAILGTAFQSASRKNDLVIGATEHHAVLEPAEHLAHSHGFRVDLLSVDDEGFTNPEKLSGLLTDKTALVSIMHANNEIGTLSPIAEIGKLCQEKGVLFHTDAVQSGAHFQLDVNLLGVDLLSLGAHKFYGPKGVGVLYIRTGTDLRPILTGGSQEFGQRAATQNIPLIVGMAAAYERVQTEYEKRTKHILPLRDDLISRILTEIPSSQLTGHPVDRLPNHASFVFDGVDGNLLISILDSVGFACSSGSACKTGDPKPSSVLTELGFSPSWALGSLRVTLGKDTTAQEIHKFLEILPGSIHQLRELRS